MTLATSWAKQVWIRIRYLNSILDIWHLQRKLMTINGFRHGSKRTNKYVNITYLYRRGRLLTLYYCTFCLIPCNPLFVLSLFRHSTSTCFGHICSPSSGAVLYIYNNWCVLCFSVDCMLAGRPTYSQLKYTARTNCCIYIQYSSWWWATNMPETCRGWLTK